jgi:hypothetical protein
MVVVVTTMVMMMMISHILSVAVPGSSFTVNKVLFFLVTVLKQSHNVQAYTFPKQYEYQLQICGHVPTYS